MGVTDHEKHHGSADRYAQETHEHKSVPPHDSLRCYQAPRSKNRFF
jgi:hypothetical protein